jgi:hypothetical protein
LKAGSRDVATAKWNGLVHGSPAGAALAPDLFAFFVVGVVASTLAFRKFPDRRFSRRAGNSSSP